MRKTLVVAVCLLIGMTLTQAQRGSYGPRRAERPAPADTAPSPGVIANTGQLGCWDDNGLRVNCVETGQDGDHQTGYSLRFTDNADGTVTDNLTKLIWLKDAGCTVFFAGDGAGQNSRIWTDALTAANRLSKPFCGLSDGSSAGDWRLPNFRELESLLDYGNPLSGLPPGHPFTGQQRTNGYLNDYWSSTTAKGNEITAWKVNGLENLPSLKSMQSSVWPVRGGYSESRPTLSYTEAWPGVVAKTGQTECWGQSGDPVDCAGTGQDGEYLMGFAVKHRFTDNGDGTVTDNLTKLIWLKKANCRGLRPWGDAVSHVNGVHEGSYSCELSDGSVSGDWRLPSVRELQSLIDFGQHSPALPPGYPFYDVRLDYYWSSTTDANRPNRAWQIPLDRGSGDTDRKKGDDDEECYSWPVRGGY